ncbi:MAG: hypothetical protein QM820_49715 [Minicystis sp.]
MRRTVLTLAFLGCAAAAACASTDTVGATYMSDVGGAGGVGGLTGAGASGTGGASSSIASSSAQASSGASSSVASSSSSASSASSSSSSSASSSSGSVCSYGAPNVCDNALELTSIDGDTGNDVRTVTGTTSKWFKVHVNEGSNLATGLSWTATLTPAPGVDFDLYIYEGNADQPNCFAAPTQANGTPESYHQSWSDSFGSEDGRWFILEVRYAGGTGCGAEAKWTLTVEGNT